MYSMFAYRLIVALERSAVQQLMWKARIVYILTSFWAE